MMIDFYVGFLDFYFNFELTFKSEGLHLTKRNITI